MDKKFLKFPKNFLWGAATAAHQVEGGTKNDWTVWEKKNAKRLAQEAPQRIKDTVPDWEAVKPAATDPKNYISGNSSDHYHRYKEDIQLMRKLNLNAYRFSVEWSRIEPEKGQYDEKALQHYHDVIKTCRQNGIEPIVTLWHFTNPIWFAEEGGWEKKKNVRYFIQFVKKISQRYKDDIHYWLTINEPIVYLTDAYLGFEPRPPEVKNPLRANQVFKNFVQAHNQAYKVIHEQDPEAEVGLPHQASFARAYKTGWLNKAIAYVFNYFSNYRLLNCTKDHLDFIGIQYYQRGLVRVKLSFNLAKIISGSVVKSGEVSDMGWEVHPHGLYVFLKVLWKKYRLPIIITENGIADRADRKRADFIKAHLVWLHRAIKEGVDVRGYLYWSLLDNQEWEKGFWPKFGLIAVNPDTHERKVKPSAKKYAEMAKKNGLDLSGEPLYLLSEYPFDFPRRRPEERE